jgi:predicted secreted protein
MANRLGHEEKIFVDNGSGTFTEIAGQTSYDTARPTNFIDQSSKTTGRISIKAAGRQDLTMTVTGKKIVPDANGLERVFAITQVYPQAPTNFQIRVTPFTGSDVRFACSMYVGNFKETGPDQDNTTYSFDLSCAATPTTDVLDA